MKTRAVPSICMLSAGLIRCIAGAVYREELKSFLWSLILVMIVFYLMGIVIKMVLDRNIKDMLEDAPTEDDLKDLENIEDDQPENMADGESVSVKEKNPEYSEEEMESRNQ